MGKLSSVALFKIEDFRSYIRAWAKSRGRGEFRRIALTLNMHTTLISQILSGRKCLTEEQGLNLCIYMKLNQFETDYFLKLIQIERAGSESLKQTYRRHLADIRRVADEVKNRVPQTKELDERDRALFYSSWQYSLIRLLTSIDKFHDPASIALYLDLSISRVQEVLDFLVTRGLCAEDRGQYRRTEKNTHIEARSPLAIRHHQNWRVKSMEFLERSDAVDLSFTAPVALAKKDIAKVRSILLEALSEISKLIEDSHSEDLAYLGIDWIKI